MNRSGHSPSIEAERALHNRKSDLNKKKVLVTGGSGFIGRRLIERLADEGASVTALVRSRRRAKKRIDSRAEIVEADLSDKAKVAAAVHGQQVVFNLAHDFHGTAEANVSAFTALADACQKASIDRLIHVSSIVVYAGWPSENIAEESPRAEPKYAYQQAKIDIEIDLRRRFDTGDLQSVILQPTIVYGPESAQWTDLQVERLLDGAVMLPGNGNGICNAVYVDDLVSALILAATAKDQAGERFIISGPSPITWRDLFSMYQEALGVNALQFYEPKPQAVENSTASSSATAVNLRGNPTIAFAIVLLRNALGDEGLRHLKRMASRMVRLGRPAVFYPSPSEFELYTSEGVCCIDKARQGLGYLPVYDLTAVKEPMTDYVASKFSRR